MRSAGSTWHEAQGKFTTEAQRTQRYLGFSVSSVPLWNSFLRCAQRLMCLVPVLCRAGFDDEGHA